MTTVMCDFHQDLYADVKCLCRSQEGANFHFTLVSIEVLSDFYLNFPNILFFTKTVSSNKKVMESSWELCEIVVSRQIIWSQWWSEF